MANKKQFFTFGGKFVRKNKLNESNYADILYLLGCKKVPTSYEVFVKADHLSSDMDLVDYKGEFKAKKVNYNHVFDILFKYFTGKEVGSDNKKTKFVSVEEAKQIAEFFYKTYEISTEDLMKIFVETKQIEKKEAKKPVTVEAVLKDVEMQKTAKISANLTEKLIEVVDKYGSVLINTKTGADLTRMKKRERIGKIIDYLSAETGKMLQTAQVVEKKVEKTSPKTEVKTDVKSEVKPKVEPVMPKKKPLNVKFADLHRFFDLSSVLDNKTLSEDIKEEVLTRVKNAIIKAYDPAVIAKSNPKTISNLQRAFNNAKLEGVNGPGCFRVVGNGINVDFDNDGTLTTSDIPQQTQQPQNAGYYHGYVDPQYVPPQYQQPQYPQGYPQGPVAPQQQYVQYNQAPQQTMNQQYAAQPQNSPQPGFEYDSRYINQQGYNSQRFVNPADVQAMQGMNGYDYMYNLGR